jgi:hypothetical protein
MFDKKKSMALNNDKKKKKKKKKKSNKMYEEYDVRIYSLLVKARMYK